MSERPAETSGWYVHATADDVKEASRAIIEGEADAPDEWPTLAIETGLVRSKREYYDLLHTATIHASRDQVRKRERATDIQICYGIRTFDDCERIANELAERTVEWGGTIFEDVKPGIDGAIALSTRESTDPIQARTIALATQVMNIKSEADRIRAFIERSMHDVAPNLTALAGPMLGARLIGLAGGLEPLAKMPSGTVQVLGAEGALFAHLQGHAPSPKHGIIYTHEYVHGTSPSNRGSAARALAGKLAIAARIDHYSGDLRPDLEVQLTERIQRINARDIDG